MKVSIDTDETNGQKLIDKVREVTRLVMNLPSEEVTVYVIVVAPYRNPEMRHIISYDIATSRPMTEAERTKIQELL